MSALNNPRDVVVSAIQELVLPRFDDQDERLAALEADMHEVKEDVRILKEDVRTLQSDMRVVKESLNRLEGRIEALEADVKELYDMIAKTNHGTVNKKFAKISIEEKILRMYDDFQLLAKEAGVTLPH